MKKWVKKIILLFLLLNYSTFCLADELIIEPDSGREPILTAIKQSKLSINLALYGLTDKSFMQPLAEAKKAGKSVRVLLEPQPYKAMNENAQAIQFLQHTQIPLHWPDTQFKFLHQKTFLFDHHAALVMTFNLTHSSFKNERNFALLITNPAMVQEIQQVFDADWQRQKVTVENPNLVWSPDNSRKKILALIQQAQSEIKIYTQNIADYQVIGALAKAARANIKVQILLSTLPTQKRLNYLLRAGVKVHFSHGYMIHAKVMLIDQKRAMIGSINLTRTSLDENRELSVITEDKKAVHELIETFKHDFS